MYKFILALLTAVFCMMLQAVQIDEQIAVQTLFNVKHAVNRAAHAAAGQVDAERLYRGELKIDESKAASAALFYLQQNLRLDESNNPLPESFLKKEVEVLLFEVINDQTFPYTYHSERYDLKVTLDRPGVIFIIQVEYPRAFSLLDDIRWTVKGSAQLYSL